MTYFEKIVDAITGEESIREYTKAEIDEVMKAKAEADAIQAQIKAQAEADAAAKQAILDRLGLTAEEAALLLK